MNKLVIFTSALALALAAPLAQAAIEIDYQIDGGPIQTCGVNPVSAGPVVCNTVTGTGFTIQEISASSNSPGTAALSQQFGSTLSISTTMAIASLTIYMSSQDFTAPTTPPDIYYLSNLSTTVTTGTGTADLTSCIDTGNGLTGPVCPATIQLTNPTINYAPGAQANSTSTVITGLTTTPYSLAQTITLSLGAGSNLNVITSQVLTQTQVPEPISLALLGGMVLLALPAIRRKLKMA